MLPNCFIFSQYQVSRLIHIDFPGYHIGWIWLKLIPCKQKHCCCCCNLKQKNYLYAVIFSRFSSSLGLRKGRFPPTWTGEILSITLGTSKAISFQWALFIYIFILLRISVSVSIHLLAHSLPFVFYVLGFVIGAWDSKKRLGSCTLKV